MIDLLTSQTEYLEYLLNDSIQQIDAHHAKIVQLNGDVIAIRKELEHRKLETFWGAHPGLRLYMGDELFVTEEAVVWEKNRPDPLCMWDGGSDSEVKRIYFNDNGELIIVIECLGFYIQAPLDLVRQMRQAYLDA
jgi:hypothetical protein